MPKFPVVSNNMASKRYPANQMHNTICNSTSWEWANEVIAWLPLCLTEHLAGSGDTPSITEQMLKCKHWDIAEWDHYTIISISAKNNFCWA